MKRVFQIVALLAVAAGGYFLWVKLHPAPEAVIRKRMEKLAELLVTKPGEGNFARVAAVNKILGFFSGDVVINGEGMSHVGETISGKTELQQALFVARQKLEGKIEFADVHVTVTSQTNAVANFTAVGRLSGERDPYAQDMKAQFVKVEGDWVIARVDPILLKAPDAP